MVQGFFLLAATLGGVAITGGLLKLLLGLVCIGSVRVGVMGGSRFGVMAWSR